MNTFIKTSLISVTVSALIFSMTGCSDSDDGGSSSDGTQTAVASGVASVSGSIATTNSGITASSAFKATATTTVDSTASALLTIDTNNNGEFGDSADTVLSSTVGSNGSFDFGGVTINETGETKAQLVVSKQGFAPVTKVISLTNGQTVSVIADAASTPLLTEVVDIQTLRTNGTLSSSFLTLGLKRTSSGLSSYAEILSLSEMAAKADVPISGDVETETVIPLAALPESVTSITAQTQSFDPTDPEDAAKFPGEYVGVGEPGEGEQRLVSVGFDYMSLTDQNGNTIELDQNQLAGVSKLLPQAVDYTSCLRTSTRYLSGAQLELFKKYGDDDNTTSAFEIPLWYYNSSAGNWQYLGQAEVYGSDGVTDYNVTSTDTYAYAKMCITENWGTSVNLDYSFAPQQPVNVCVVAQDQDGNAISNLYVEAQNDTARDGHYLDNDGKAQIALLAGANLADYEFSYSGALTGWNSTTVQSTDIVTGGEAGCDNTLNIEVVNPYSATLTVTVKELDGSLATDKWVYVYNSDWTDYYYESAYTDANGQAVFKVKPNTNYGVYYNAASVDVNINGTTTAPEEADNGRIATVTLQEQEIAPVVEVYVSQSALSNAASSLNFYVYAEDGNGDTITRKSLTLNGTPLVEGTDYTVNYEYSYNNYVYMSATLNLDAATVSAITPTSLAAGDYSLEATYSDGKADGVSAQRFTVTANRAPEISSVYLYDTTTGYYSYINSSLKTGTYDVYAYAYDPDADDVTLTYTLDGTATDGSALVLNDGEHTLVVSATDGALTTDKTFTFYTGNNAPEITSFGATSYSIDLNSADKTISLYAYAQDKDGDAITVQTLDGNITLTPNYRGSNYFVSTPITVDANTTFTIVANDGDKNSTAKSLTVTTYRANQAPVFTQELTPLSIATGSEATFTCVATDPEGDAVTYSWALNGTTLDGETATTFTHTFTTTSVVSCTATDADVLEPMSVTSTATVTVYNPTATGNLVINTLPGAIVALHDATTLVAGETKTTDSNGVASFAISGTDRVTFSISVYGDLAVDKALIMEQTLFDIANILDYICAPTGSEPDACSTYDRTTLIAGSTIPNSLGDLALANAGETITSADLDTNGDGAVDIDENYNYLLSTDDNNSDGVLSWTEFTGNDNVTSEFFVNVPVREYTISLYEYQDGYQDEFYYDKTWTNAPTTMNFSGFPEGTEIRINSNRVTVSADGNVTFSSDYALGSNTGLYSYAASYLDENNVTKYLLALDKTADEVKSVSYTPSDFTIVGKNVTLDALETEYMSVSMSYNYSYLAGLTKYDTLQALIDDSRLTYSYYSSMSVYDSVTGNSTWFSNSYSDVGALASTYSSTIYPYLNVNFQFDNVDTLSVSGSDLSKVNSMRVEYSSVNTDDANNSVYVHTSFTYTIAPSTFVVPSLTKILPAAVVPYVSGTVSAEYLYINSYEYVNTTETEFLDAVNGDNYYSLYENGYRSSSTYMNVEKTVTAASTISQDVKAKIVRPFSIGYEAKSLFE